MCYLLNSGGYLTIAWYPQLSQGQCWYNILESKRNKLTSLQTVIWVAAFVVFFLDKWWLLFANELSIVYLNYILGCNRITNIPYAVD